MTRRTGSFGTVGSQVATPLSMVLTEVLQNAFEHAFTDGRSGTLSLTCRRDPTGLEVVVEDDGIGLPPGFDAQTSTSLGLSIVRTLVGELDGEISIGARAETQGTRVVLFVPMDEGKEVEETDQI